MCWLAAAVAAAVAVWQAASVCAVDVAEGGCRVSCPVPTCSCCCCCEPTPLFPARASPCRSPVQWMGPKRVVPPAFSVDDPRLPKVDAVLLSHNHYGKACKGHV